LHDPSQHDWTIPDDTSVYHIFISGYRIPERPQKPIELATIKQQKENFEADFPLGKTGPEATRLT